LPWSQKQSNRPASIHQDPYDIQHQGLRTVQILNFPAKYLCNCDIKLITTKCLKNIQLDQSEGHHLESTQSSIIPAPKSIIFAFPVCQLIQVSRNILSLTTYPRIFPSQEGGLPFVNLHQSRGHHVAGSKTFKDYSIIMLQKVS
jgi:hypothetical protein